MENQNTMLEYYHPGAYGSQQKEKWSCCSITGVMSKGCEICVDDTETLGILTDSNIDF